MLAGQERDHTGELIKHLYPDRVVLFVFLLLVWLVLVCFFNVYLSLRVIHQFKDNCKGCINLFCVVRTLRQQKQTNILLPENVLILRKVKCSWLNSSTLSNRPAVVKYHTACRQRCLWEAIWNKVQISYSIALFCSPRQRRHKCF